MDFTIQLRERESRQAEALQARLFLKDISLFECEAAGAGPPDEAVDPVSLTASLDSGVSRVNDAGIDFAVTLRVASEEDHTFHIQTTFLVRYRRIKTGKPASKTELNAFCKSYPAIAAWPYIRETVQALASRMGFPTEPLALLRLVIRQRSRPKNCGLKHRDAAELFGVRPPDFSKMLVGEFRQFVS